MEESKPDHFLRLIRRAASGRLKIYLGYCAGVGKTFRMLQEGQLLKKEGIDVVAGFVETHGRADVENLLAGLEAIPRLVSEYRGIRLEEMDVDAVIARRPAVALVDELAHTNTPGGRNRKRYQDVQEILAAGIHVITTLNVQHLESLYNTVERLVGVKVRERIPDSVVGEADQIVNVDLTTEDLQKRLLEGRIYPRERIQCALANFFTPPNLENLRELTMREIAAQIDSRRKEPGADEPPPMPDQVLVCLSSRGPNSELLLRYASRLAGRLNKNWYALYVQRDAEAPTQIDIKTQMALSNTLTLAKQLGAIVFTYKGDDLAETILGFAREYRIGHIIVGTPARLSFLARLLQRKTLSERLVQRAKGVNVIVVSTMASPTDEMPPAEKEIPAPGSGAASLSNLLRGGNVVIWEDAPLKEEVLRRLTLATFGAGAGVEQVQQALLLRERQSSTFFNEGVAFPHVRVAGDFTPKVALGIMPAGIADSGTMKPIRLVFLFISPESQVEVQARLLAQASRIAGNQPLLDALLKCRSSEEVRAAIEAWEVKGARASG